MNKDNFRPVSIHSILSKLYESVLNEQILDHFREICDALLSSYGRHYSSQIVLLKFVEDVRSALDGGHKVGSISMFYELYVFILEKLQLLQLYR